MTEDIYSLIARMTLEEKASLCSGADTWRTQSIERLGIPAIRMTDGPHGLRKEKGDGGLTSLSHSVPSTCFPTASATASSWDRQLLEEIGRAIGEECQQEDVQIVLGPGANIKRSPLCGRNFEYFSEDPFLTGELAAAWIRGAQSTGVGASLKHYAVNNQEYRRMAINAVVDERTLHEIYLPGFERAVKKSQPWTVMCSYNKVNGTYASENMDLLTRILRDEWGFQGVVVTDWGACNERAKGLRAGQELEMPSSNGLNNAKIVAAVKSGALPETVLDRAVERLLRLILNAHSQKKTDYLYDSEAHHTLARRAAAESIVLLKNEGLLLPLSTDRKMAVIGAFANSPRYQGSGSSQINPCRLDNAWDELSKAASNLAYAQGYDPGTDIPNEEMIRAACQATRTADVALVFAGLPNIYESEGFDREHMRLPESHNLLIERVAQANPNTVVILWNGAAVEMPWAGQVKAILESFLGGQATGGAVVDVLLGKVNPSGKLAETFAHTLDDYPSSAYFPGGPKTVEYREGIYVGYRYFEKAAKSVLFPFGFGLSYTTFTCSDLVLSASRISDKHELGVSIKVQNTGTRAGAEVIQLYVRDIESTIFRPEKELKGFEKVFLQPGEDKRIQFSLDRRAFACYHPGSHDWQVESGAFEILVGTSSAEIVARSEVWVESSAAGLVFPDLRGAAPVYYQPPAEGFAVPDSDFQAVYGKELPPNQRLPGEPHTINSLLADLQDNFIGRKFYGFVVDKARKMMPADENKTNQKMMLRMMEEMPLRNMVTMSRGLFSEDLVEALLLMMNRKRLAGAARLLGYLVKRKPARSY